MRLVALFIPLLITVYSYSQIRPNNAVYIIEGVVADRETLKGLPSAILYNDSLHITTTSDENGYFKIVLPYELIRQYDLFRNQNFLRIDVLKAGYKGIAAGVAYNHDEPDSVYMDSLNMEIWGNNVKIFWMPPGLYAPAKEEEHGPAGTMKAFDKAVASILRKKKFDRLKQGNDKVYFPLDGETGLATSGYDIVVIGNLTHVFIDDKKVNISDINNLVKRDEIRYDNEKSKILTEKYRKETLAFTITPISRTTPDGSISLSGMLIIHIKN
jgi:hypothetical protein